MLNPRTLLIAPLLLLLLSCGEGPRLPPLDEEAVILAFGDSLTHGTGAGPDESYPAHLGRMTGRKVVNEGIPGEESDAALERLPGVLARVRPALVILGHGGNDMLRKRDLARTEENLRRMVELARGQGAKVILLGIPKPGLFLGPHPMYPRLAETLALPLERDALSDILADRALKSDTIHPNAAGYRELAEALMTLLDESGALG